MRKGVLEINRASATTLKIKFSDDILAETRISYPN